MGLDITAYRQLKPAPHAKLEDGQPVEWDRFVSLDVLLSYTEENWPGRTAPLVPGVYSHAESHGFRAGSYSGYGAWRTWLAQRAGYGSAQNVWKKDNPQGPFVELINFSDCEGIIGPVVSAKLAKDFAEYESSILNGEEETWEARLYREWRKAFEMAADGGCVEFS